MEAELAGGRGTARRRPRHDRDEIDAVDAAEAGDVAFADDRPGADEAQAERPIGVSHGAMVPEGGHDGAPAPYCRCDVDRCRCFVYCRRS
jgi:hypothetical protein